MAELFGEIKGPFAVWLFLTVYSATLVVMLTTFAVFKEFTFANLLGQAVAFWGVVLGFIVGFIFLKEKHRSLSGIFSSLGFRRSGIGKSLLWSFALLPLFIVIGLFSSVVLSFLNPNSSSIGSVVVAGAAGQLPSWYFWFLLVESFFPVAVVEEAFARGYMLDRLMPQHPSSLFKALPAVLLSSLFSTLWHLPVYLTGYGFSIPLAAALLAVNVFPISLVLGIAYVRARTRNIVGPVFMHFLLDAMPIVLSLTLI